MKVLVATNQTQGQRPDDFCFTLEGELVRLPSLVCDCPDCGCERAVEGMASHEATTTFTITDWVDLDSAGYRKLLVDHLVDGRWVVGEPGTEETAWVEDFVDLHLFITREFAVGDVLEVHNGAIARRSVSSVGRATG